MPRKLENLTECSTMAYETCQKNRLLANAIVAFDAYSVMKAILAIPAICMLGLWILVHSHSLKWGSRIPINDRHVSFSMHCGSFSLRLDPAVMINVEDFLFPEGVHRYQLSPVVIQNSPANEYGYRGSRIPPTLMDTIKGEFAMISNPSSGRDFQLIVPIWLVFSISLLPFAFALLRRRKTS